MKDLGIKVIRVTGGFPHALKADSDRAAVPHTRGDVAPPSCAALPWRGPPSLVGKGWEWYVSAIALDRFGRLDRFGLVDSVIHSCRSGITTGVIDVEAPPPVQTGSESAIVFTVG